MSLARLLRNIFSNHARVVTASLVGFILTPLLFHFLGPVYYAVFVLALAVKALAESLDMGMTSTLIRFVSELSAPGSDDEWRRLASTVFFLLLGVGVLAASGVALLSPLVGSWFHVRAGTSLEAPTALALVCLAVAFQLPAGAVRGLLHGFQAFHLTNAVDIATDLLRGVATVILLYAGYRLLAVAALVPLAALLRLAGMLAMAHRAPARFRPRWREVNWPSLKKVRGFASLTLVRDTAVYWLAQSDNFLAARLLTLPELAILAVARKFPNALALLVNQTLGVAYPMVTSAAARDDRRALERFMVVSTRNLLGVLLPITAALFLWAELILRLWIGPEVLPGVPVFRGLLAYACFQALQEVPLTFLYALGRIQFSTLVAASSLVGAIALGGWACWYHGLVGLALAFAFVQAVATVMLYVQALALAQIHRGWWFKKAVTIPFLAGLAATGTMMAVYWLLPHSLLAMILSVAIELALFVLVFAGLVMGRERLAWRARLRRLLMDI